MTVWEEHKTTLWALPIALVLIFLVQLPPILIYVDTVRFSDTISYTYCNERGIIYDELGNNTCTCFGCYSGKRCETPITDCVEDLRFGQPMLHTAYWGLNHSTATYISTDYRTFYFTKNQFEIPQLEDTIKQLHDLTGNVNYDNKTLVIGLGATQILSGLMWSLSKVLNKQITIFVSEPYYYFYPRMATLYPFCSKWNNSMNQNGSDVVEVVTTPNNPDGFKRTPFYPDAMHIYDLAYYWPCYTTIDERMDEDIMIFTTSKLSGHAGSRLGWAWIKDPNLAFYLKQYISTQMNFIQPETQYRILNIWKGIISGQSYFEQIQNTLLQRYENVSQILNSQSIPQRFSLLSAPGGFYLWIHCNFPSDYDCQNTFVLEAGIAGSSGIIFGTNSSYVRFNFALFESEYNTFIQRLTDIIQQPGIKGNYQPLPPDPYYGNKC